MTELAAPLAAALLAGLAGGVHCLGMCAGVSGLFALHAGAASLRHQLPLAVVYNAGRLATYALLGYLVAAAGWSAVSLAPALAGPVRVAAGVVLILIGLQIALELRLLARIESVGAVIWNRVSPLARRLLPVRSTPGAFGLGLLWGLLPCGLVYSMLLLATGSAEPAHGALLMLAFGVGTLPAMLATGLAAARLAHWTRRRWLRLGAGLIVVALGILTAAVPLATALSSPGQSHHESEERM